MSATDGLALQACQGARRRRSATTSGLCPAWAYHTMAKLRQSSPNGTVRSTALGVRLRAWPTPAGCLAWQDRDLDRPPGVINADAHRLERDRDRRSGDA